MKLLVIGFLVVSLTLPVDGLWLSYNFICFSAMYEVGGAAPEGAPLELDLRCSTLPEMF